jgi:thioredoxin 1
MSKPIKVTDDSFATDVLKSTGPVLVDFWAEWCGPCKMMAPALDDVATEFDGKLTVAKIDIDDNTDTPSKFHVRGIPTLILFKNGEAVAQKVGAMPKSALQAWIKEHI